MKIIPNGTPKHEIIEYMTQKMQETAAGFHGLGIHPKLLAALDSMKFHTPTPIQRQAIPVVCGGNDVVGIAQTGTGKTIAFAIPMLQSLAEKPGSGLVLVPTRELALQVDSVFKQFTHSFGMNTAVLIGGEPIIRQKRALRAKPRVLIATPGRLIDHLEQGSVRLSDTRVLVLDEADRMLDMGFAPQMERILKVVPQTRQTMLFSATMPDAIMKLASAYMKLPVRVEVARSGTAAEKVVQQVYIVSKPSKPDLLGKLLDKNWGRVLLFSRTKHGAKKIARAINSMGHSAAEIHSGRSLPQRREALDGFKAGKYRILVATDIAARGIDVTGIELVLNYDLPDDSDNYVHRIGRTGRAGHDGLAISFASPDQGPDLRAIERVIRTTLPIVTHPDMPVEHFLGGHQHPPQQGRGSRQAQQRNGSRHGQQQQHSRPPQHGPRQEQRHGGQHSDQSRHSGGSAPWHGQARTEESPRQAQGQQHNARPAGQGNPRQERNSSARHGEERRPHSGFAPRNDNRPGGFGGQRGKKRFGEAGGKRHGFGDNRHGGGNPRGDRQGGQASSAPKKSFFGRLLEKGKKLGFGS